MTHNGLSAELKTTLTQLGRSDIVFGVASQTTGDTGRAVETIREAVRSLSPDLRAVVAMRSGSDGQHTTGAGIAADAAFQTVVCALPPIQRFPLGVQDGYGPLRVMSGITSSVGARACVVVGSDPNNVTPEAIRLLLRPILDMNCDIVVPCYARHALDGLINTGVVYPLTRGLYGKRVRNQIGVDFGFSVRLMETVAQPMSAMRNERPVWLVTHAVCGGMRVCQANLDMRLPPAEEQLDLSIALAHVVGSLFLDMERTAPFWQKVRGSQPVPTVGAATPVVKESAAIDVRPMIDSFRIGYGNLRDVWGLILPPAALMELGRLTRVAPEQFRFPDGLWARVVFDFALGHRLRVISRDHLLRAMTPLYLAWVASFVQQTVDAAQPEADDRIEQLCLAFEAEKPYLFSRWRWPDRFNP